METPKLTKTRNKLRDIFFILLQLLVIFMIFTFWINSKIWISEYTITSANLPEPFDGFKIAQVSDLHNAEFGKDNELLISKLKEARPNIIVITGDLVDYRKTKFDIAHSFVSQALKIAPCYLVTGNHEAWLGKDWETFAIKLEETGVKILRDEITALKKDGAIIHILGLQDPDMSTEESYLHGADMLSKLNELNNATADNFTLLLSHRPEHFDVYVAAGMDLVLTGHAHGGQFRLPFIGGLIAPNQGLFPKYDAGEFTEDKTTMIVSRGIGASIIPIRINNPPELVVVELKQGN